MVVYRPPEYGYLVTLIGAPTPPNEPALEWLRSVKETRVIRYYTVVASSEEQAAFNVGRAMSRGLVDVDIKWREFNPNLEYRDELRNNPPDASDSMTYTLSIDQILTLSNACAMTSLLRMSCSQTNSFEELTHNTYDSIVVGGATRDQQELLMRAAKAMSRFNPHFFIPYDPHDDTLVEIASESSSAEEFIEKAQPLLEDGVTVNVETYIRVTAGGLLVPLPPVAHFSAFQGHWGQQQWR